MARVAATVRPLINYCPEGLGSLGRRSSRWKPFARDAAIRRGRMGRSVGSRMAALVMLRLSCPRKERNFYTEEFPSPKAQRLPAMAGVDK